MTKKLTNYKKLERWNYLLIDVVSTNSNETSNSNIYYIFRFCLNTQ